MYQSNDLAGSLLSERGLNLQAIFNIDQLPVSILAALKNTQPEIEKYTQLILLAHGGQTLWQALKTSGLKSDNPVDDFSIDSVHQFFKKHYETNQYTIIYPGESALDLQQLGQLAGWHHPSPFKVGINKHWGSWFAYRAVILTNTAFKATARIDDTSPCNSCHRTPCIEACPAGAMANNDFRLQACVDYRKQANSSCKDRCLARLRCPVAAHHRYSDEQIHYHYSVSMRVIEKFY